MFLNVIHDTEDDGGAHGTAGDGPGDAPPPDPQRKRLEIMLQMKEEALRSLRVEVHELAGIKEQLDARVRDVAVQYVCLTVGHLHHRFLFSGRCNDAALTALLLYVHGFAG
jgi:hypothetical protein